MSLQQESGRDHLIEESVLSDFAKFGRKKVGRPFLESGNTDIVTVESGRLSASHPLINRIQLDEEGMQVINGDTRDIIKRLPDDTFRCVVTSPPYWGVRDYGVENQIGAEPDLQDYIKALVEIFSEVRRVLKSDGTFWLNLGNTYTSGGRKWRQEDFDF